ncbi:MAG: triose-phosphate isomerase [Chloroflexi bacterium]|nr:MAG: triose-phosphate isomerase [Chloroflexota bacterium]
MRKPIIAGNWKMHKTVAEAVQMIRELIPALTSVDPEAVDVVVCPPFTALKAVREAIGSAPIGLGAQNMHWEPQGAFTGEISPRMLKELCQYVIIGHSERRQYFGETDEGVNRKLKAALAHGLTPIVCVGENLEQNEAGQTEAVVGGQVRAAFAGLTAEQARQVILAYEPIWAIGTGKPATGPGANAIIAQAIRGTLTDLYGEEVAQAIRVQYGGSVKPNNIAEFMAQPEIDGALVGGASLQAESFAGIIRNGLAAL